MQKIIDRIGQVYFWIIMVQYLILLGIQIVVVAIIRLFRKKVLNFTSHFEGWTYTSIKPFLYLAFKMVGVEIRVTKPVK